MYLYNKLISVPHPKLLASLLAMIAYSFLPSSIILYATPLCLVFASSFWMTKNVQKSFLIVIIFSVFAALLFPIIGLFALLLFMFPLIFLISIWPTAINIMASYWLCKVSGITGYARFSLFVAISLFLGFNSRIPSMFEDIVGQSKMIESTRVLSVASDKGLIVTGDIEPIAYLATPFDYLSATGSEGCMCFYWEQPRIIKEDVLQYLSVNGIPHLVSNLTPKNQSSLSVSVKESGGIAFADYFLQDESGRTASLKLKKRKKYPLEPDFTTEQLDINSPYARFQYVAHSNMWNFFVYALYSISKYQNPNPLALKPFIEAKIKVKESRQPLFMTVSANQVADFPKMNDGSWNQKSCEQIPKVGFDFGYTLKSGYSVKWNRREKSLIFEHNGIVRTVDLAYPTSYTEMADFQCTVDGKLELATHPVQIINNWAIDVREFLPDGTQSKRLLVYLPQQFNDPNIRSLRLLQTTSSDNSYVFKLEAIGNPQMVIPEEAYFVIANIPKK